MRALRCKPMRYRRAPGYPTKLEVLASPDLLKQHLLRSWLSGPELAGAMAAMLALNTGGCSDHDTTPGTASPGFAPPPDSAIVAPIFERGTGEAERYAGCVGTPPQAVYVSEEDGIRIIRDELALAGLPMRQRDVQLPGVIIKGFEMSPRYEWTTDEEATEPMDATGPLEADLKDSRSGVAVEFVAETDFYLLGGDADRISYSEDLKGLAGSVADEVRKQGKGIYFGAFYDPVAYVDSLPLKIEVPEDVARAFDDAKTELDREKVREAFHKRIEQSQKDARRRAEIESKRLLRQQVRDFIDWLKAQGVI